MGSVEVIELKLSKYLGLKVIYCLMKKVNNFVLVYGLYHDQSSRDWLPGVFKWNVLLLSVMDYEESKSKSDDQNEKVGEAFDQVLGDAVEHQTQASA